MSGQEVVLTVDVGGSGLKLSAYSLDRHRSLAVSTTPWPAESLTGNGSEFDVQMWWGTTVAALTRFVTKLHDIAPGWSPIGVTVGAIRIPFVLLDAQNEIVRPCLRNSDRRAVSEVAELRNVYGDDTMYAATGHWLTPEFGLPKLQWLRNHEPASLARTRTVLQLHDWFIYRLCGARCSEPSSAAMSQLLDSAGDRWAEDLLNDLDFPLDWFPQLQPSGTRAGMLDRAVSAATGLPSDVPVHLGGGDAQLSALSAGALHSSASPVVIAGTTVPVQQAVAGDTRPRGSAYPALCSRQLLPRWWTVETNAGGVGGTLDTLRRLDPALQGTALVGALSAAGLDPAPKVLDTDRLFVTVGNPVFGSRSWSNPPRPAVHGLRPTDTARDVYLAALTCSAVAVAEMITGVSDTATSCVEAVMLTGGLSANKSWIRQLADAAQRTVIVADTSVVSGIGGAGVVHGDSLWTRQDTETAQHYRPRNGVAPEFREAYRALWGAAATSTDQVDEVPTCVR